MTLGHPPARSALPEPVETIEAGLASLRDHGLAIMEGVTAGAWTRSPRRPAPPAW
jgi:hypothetical protein